MKTARLDVRKIYVEAADLPDEEASKMADETSITLKKGAIQVVCHLCRQSYTILAIEHKLKGGQNGFYPKWTNFRSHFVNSCAKKVKRNNDVSNLKNYPQSTNNKLIRLFTQAESQLTLMEVMNRAKKPNPSTSSTPTSSNPPATSTGDREPIDLTGDQPADREVLPMPTGSAPRHDVGDEQGVF